MDEAIRWLAWIPVLDRQDMAGEPPKHETDRAYLVNDGEKDHWLPKQFTENNGDGTFTIPEWLAIERGIA